MIVYEWDVEEVSALATDDYEKGEVIEHWHQSSFLDALKFSRTTPPEGSEYVIVLVRDDDNGRAWAYLEDGKLPDYALDAADNKCGKIPVRFHKEVAKHGC